MPDPLLPTAFLPAALAPLDQLERQIRFFGTAPHHVLEMLDTVSDALLVLNEQRQIVFASEGMARLTGKESLEQALGSRLGEVLGCIRARDGHDACGTTEFCRQCGAAQAMVSAQNQNEDVRECRLIISDDGEALDLRVHARPIEVDGEAYTVFSVADISHEKRRRALERVFFHDVLNTASGMRTLAELMPSADDNTRVRISKLLSRLTDQLIDEILSQRDLISAEQGDLGVVPTSCRTRDLLQDVANHYARLGETLQCTLRIDPSSVSATFESDPTLVRRVLGNMVKNGLEACKKGQNVTLGCRMEKGEVAFWVHNPGHMPRAVQLQVFQRSFSTKEAGRGVGTYSMQLLTRRYLKGSIRFSSSAENGTTFTAAFPLNYPSESNHNPSAEG